MINFIAGGLIGATLTFFITILKNVSRAEKEHEKTEAMIELASQRDEFHKLYLLEKGKNNELRQIICNAREVR